MYLSTFALAGKRTLRTSYSLFLQKTLYPLVGYEPSVVPFVFEGSPMAAHHSSCLPRSVAKLCAVASLAPARLMDLGSWNATGPMTQWDVRKAYLFAAMRKAMCNAASSQQRLSSSELYE